jgi:hypothetical protein
MPAAAPIAFLEPSREGVTFHGCNAKRDNPSLIEIPYATVEGTPQL